MQSDKTKRKISLKAKVIFILIPFFGLFIFELIARYIIKPQFIPDLKTLQIPPVVSTDNLDPMSEKALKRNYELLARCKRMLGLPIHERDRDCFYHLAPNATFSFRKPGAHKVSYETNSHGFRGNEFSIKKSKDKLRIVCAGDSSTFGYFMNLPDTYPERLGKMLETGTVEKNAEVINAGIMAYSSYQGVKFIDKFVRKLEPDILIASYGFNDSYQGWFSDAHTELESKMTAEVRNSLENLASYRLIENLLNPWKGNVESLRTDVPRVNHEEYRQNLEKLEAICREDNIHLVLMPVSAPVGYVDVARNFAEEKGCGFIDIESIFQEYHNRFLKEGPSQYKGLRFGQIIKRSFVNYYFERYGSREMTEMRQFNYLFMDYCHPTPVGYYIIAESIYEYLIEHGFFTRADEKTTIPADSSPLALLPLSSHKIVK